MLPKGHGESILVVDDEAAIREITSGILEINGYRAITASDGAEAVVKYTQKREEIKAVLMDIMMPVMDGPESIKALCEVNPTIKIIVVSALTKQDKIEKIADLIQAFLPKPYTVEKLLNTLHDVISQNGGELTVSSS